MVPVFIGGCSRSGTTLLGSVLGAHPDAVCVPESQFKIRLISSALPAGPLDRDQVVDWLCSSFRFRIWHLDRASLLESLPSLCSAAELMTSLARFYAQRLGRAEAGFWIDHTPNNIRYFLLLARTFPPARFIHLVRDPRGVASSLKPLDWGPNHSHTCARLWLQQVAFGLAAEDRLGERVLRVRYEDVLEDPRAAAQAICRFLDVEYDPTMLRADGFRVPSYSQGQHRLVGDGLEPSRSRAWERSLSPREIELVEATVCDLLDYFGYTARFGASARPLTGWERLSCSLRDLIRTEVSNRWRLRRRRRALVRESVESPGR